MRLKFSLISTFSVLTRLPTDAEQMANVRFGALMGLKWTDFDCRHGNDEVEYTRRKLTNVRRRALKERCPVEYSMEGLVDRSDIPHHIMEKIQDDKLVKV